MQVRHLTDGVTIKNNRCGLQYTLRFYFATGYRLSEIPSGRRYSCSAAEKAEGKRINAGIETVQPYRVFFQSQGRTYHWEFSVEIRGSQVERYRSDNRYE
jgi:hypothetical protein